MKKLILGLAVGLFTLSGVFAQEATTTEPWYNSSFEDSGIYGINTEKAYHFLEEHNRQPVEIIVGVLDSGVQADHEDLAANMWVNPKEKAGNGKDDDGNGYIDDIYGWNFIGGPDGTHVGGDTLEQTRLMRYKYMPLFESEDKTQNEENRTQYPEDYKTYLEIKQEIGEKTGEAKGMLRQMQGMKEMIDSGFPPLIEAFGDEPVTEESLGKYNPTAETMGAMATFAFVPKEFWDGKTMQQVYDAISEEFEDGVEYYQSQIDYHYNVEFESRPIVGDNYDNKTERIYGNNDVEGPDADHGTHVAGLIAAVRDNDKGIQGIGGNTIRIMAVRAVPNGDERDKDVANAIRYAADNGAKIMNMSFGKDYSPEHELVWEAMRHAESKGALLVQAAGNDDKNIDVEESYPASRDKTGQPIIQAHIVVGASTPDAEMLKASFSNYGKETVHVFSPGTEILSTVPKNRYKEEQGTSMASPIVAGVAALIWSHYPKLTNVEVKEIILQSVNKNPQLEEISITGGVVDAYKAVQLAEEMYKNK